MDNARIARHLSPLIDGLPEAELAAAQRFLEFLPQETISPGFRESIRRGLAEADAGRTVLCHSYDDMVAKIVDGEASRY